jgi:quinol monooxygenase YgiN
VQHEPSERSANVSDEDLYGRLAAASESHEATDTRRTTVICHCHVGDFEHWKAGYERAVAADSGVLGYRIWRGQDDPGLVVIEETHDSRSHAEAMLDHPATREAMERDGIDLSTVRWDYLDEVDSWTR